MKFERILLGNREIADSEKRKVKLGAYLLLIYIGIDLFFFIVNLFNQEGKPWSLFLGFAISAFCLFLLRLGYTNTAIVIHLLRCNFFALYFCLIDFDPLQTGSFLYFIPSSLGALAVFGYRERWKGIGFTFLSYSLFTYAIFDPERFHPNDAHYYLIVSFLIVMIIGILIVIFFDRMVMSTEKSILAKNEELTKTNLELDRFVYSASHDLRAPLTSMAGLIQLAERDAEMTPEYLKLMKERLRVMDTYIKDIVEYSRNARMELKYSKIPLKQLVEDVVTSLKYSVDPQRVSVRIAIKDSFLVNTDQTRLRVVLTNLIGNAFKYQDYTKPNPYLSVFSARENGQSQIHIEDNGIGIRKEHHPHIFEMFYRANDVTEGSGLGLYIAQESVSRLSGTISFTSTYGEGSRFTITIPN